ncbi:MAG: carboxypeptidase-like regulatory domain-containing protein [Candidatus Diapherotrites archaeon]
MHDEYELKPEDYGEEEGKNQSEGVDLSGMQALKPVIALLVIGIIGFFAFTYFVGDIKKVSFTAKDLTGKNISGFTVKVTDSEGNVIATSKNGEEIELRKGSYRISITATGYKSIRSEEIEIERDTSKEFILTKNISATIQGFHNMPQYFLPEQDLNLMLKISSQSNAEGTIAIEFSKENDIFEKIDNIKVTLIPGTNDIPVQFKVKKKSSISGKIGKDLSGTIKFLDDPSINESFSFKVASIEKTDLEIFPGIFEFEEKLKAGETASSEISITNKNTYAKIENIRIKLNITNSGKVTNEEALEWISISPESIAVLQPNSQQSETIALNAEIPIDAVSQNISGNLEITFGNQTIKTKTFRIAVEKAEFDFELKDFPETILIQKDANDLVFPLTEQKFILSHKGDIEIKAVSLTNSCEPAEATAWIKSTNEWFDVFPLNEDKEITLRIQSETNEAQTINCTLTISYSNPLNQIERLKITKIYAIEFFH